MMASILHLQVGHSPSFRFFTLIAQFSHMLLCPQGCKMISGGHSMQITQVCPSSSCSCCCAPDLFTLAREAGLVACKGRCDSEGGKGLCGIGRGRVSMGTAGLALGTGGRGLVGRAGGGLEPWKCIYKGTAFLILHLKSTPIRRRGAYVEIILSGGPI